MKLLSLIIVMLTALPAYSQCKSNTNPRCSPNIDFYVSTTGTAGGSGSISSPWDLATALTHPAALPEGGILWVRGGTYTGNFSSVISSITLNKPIQIRAYGNERPIIDGSTTPTTAALTILGGLTHWYGLEITNSNTDRTINRGTGVDIYGPGTRFANNVVHDTGNCVGFWTQSETAEVYGNRLYNCGMNIPGYAHGVYGQNAVGTKSIRDNIIFNQFGFGIHVYGESGQLSGFNITGNASFNNGVLNVEALQKPNLFVGGNQPAERIVADRNYTYQGAVGITRGANIQMYYGATINEDLVFTNNYSVGGNFEVEWWSPLTLTGNKIYSDGTHIAAYGFPASPVVTLNNNIYHYVGGGGTPFLLEGTGSLNFATWQTSGLDANSTYSASAPTGIEAFVRPNVYDNRRAMVVVYNWDQVNSTNISLTGFLRNGDLYEIRDAQDYFKGAIASGTYNGTSASFPLNETTVSAPVGYATPAHTNKEFNVFLVIRR